MKRACLFLFLNLLLYSSDGQNTFYRDYMLNSTFGAGDIGHVLQTFDGGLIVLMKGFYDGPQQYDAALFKTDSSGFVQWSWFLDDTIPGHVYYTQNVIQSPDSSYFFCFNMSESPTTNRPVVVKIDKNGIFLWKKRYAGTSLAPGRLAHDGNNGFVFASQIGQIGVGLTHCDSNGNIIWQKGYAVSLFELRLAISTLLLSGTRYAFQGIAWNNTGPLVNYHFLMLTDNAGIPTNCTIYGSGPSNNWPHDLQQTASKDFIMCGGTQNFCVNQGNTSYMLRTDSLGNIRWYKWYDCSTDIADIVIDDNDDWSLFGSYNASFLLASADTNGNILNAKTTGTWATNYTSGFLYNVSKVGTGYIAVGGNNPGFIVKLDSAKNGFCQSLPRTISSTNASITDSSLTVAAFNTSLIVTPLSAAYAIPGWLYANTICSSVITSTETDILNQDRLQIYPNPVSDQLTVELSDSSPNEIRIFNAQGVLKISKEFKGERITFDIRNLVTGVYFLQVRTETKVLSRVFVKQ